MKLDLEGKMVPVVGGFWWVSLISHLFLIKRPGSFCTSWLLPKMSFPKHIIEVSLHLQAQHCSHKTFCCQTKDNLYLLLLCCFPRSKKKKKPQKIPTPPPPENKKKTKQNCQIGFASDRKRLLSPWFLVYLHADYTLFCPSSSICSHQGQKFTLLRWKLGLSDARVYGCFTETPKTRKLKILTFPPLSKFAFYFLYLFTLKKNTIPFFHSSFIFPPNIVNVPKHEVFSHFQCSLLPKESNISYFWKWLLSLQYEIWRQRSSSPSGKTAQRIPMWKSLCWVEEMCTQGLHTLPGKINPLLLVEHTAFPSFALCLDFLPKEMAMWKEWYTPRSHQNMLFGQDSTMGIKAYDRVNQLQSLRPKRYKGWLAFSVSLSFSEAAFLLKSSNNNKEHLRNC